MRRQIESEGLRALYDEFVGDDPEMIERYEAALSQLEVGVAINRLRTDAGLTLKDLAAKVGTQASAISRLESASYEGHSLAMLRRIAAALGRRVEIRFPRDGRDDGKPREDAAAKTQGTTASEATTGARRGRRSKVASGNR